MALIWPLHWEVTTESPQCLPQNNKISLGWVGDISVSV